MDLMDAKAKVVATLRLTEFVSYHWETSVPVYEMPLGPYIPLTDHEAALADLAERHTATERNACLMAELANDEKRKRQALLTGLEALAWEWDAKVQNELGYGPSGVAVKWCAGQLRTLTNSAKGE